MDDNKISLSIKTEDNGYEWSLGRQKG